MLISLRGNQTWIPLYFLGLFKWFCIPVMLSCTHKHTNTHIFVHVRLHPWMEVSLDAPSILSNNQCQVEEKCTKELDSQRKWTKFNFSRGRSSCLPHKAKTYYEMGTNVIIIQTWWGALYLMEPFNLVHLTTILALWSWFCLGILIAPLFGTSGSCINWEPCDLVGCVQMAVIDLLR